MTLVKLGLGDGGVLSAPPAWANLPLFVPTGYITQAQADSLIKPEVK